MGILNLLNSLQNANLLGYIDPAATSVLISSLTAIVIAIGASAIIIWRKLKNKVNKTLHIDPNSKKEVEEDIVVTDESLVEETENTKEVKNISNIENNIKIETVENKTNEEPKNTEPVKAKTSSPKKTTPKSNTGAKSTTTSKSGTKSTSSKTTK